MVLEDAMIMNV